MRHFQKAGVGLLAGLAGLAGVACGGSALAQGPQRVEPYGGSDQGAQAPQQRGEQGKQGTQGVQRGQVPEQQANPKGLGAGIGGQNVGAEGGCAGKAGGEYSLGPLSTGGMGQGFGAGIGEQGGEQTEPGKVGQNVQPAPVPQYWLADASLFVANAGNAAQTLANEQTLGVQAPSVLGNQAHFLIASTDRAISSLTALEAQAKASNPRAIAEIRTAMDQLAAAKVQAQQMLDAANAGTLGPNSEAMIRSTYDHLQAAGRDIGSVGRTYGAQGFTLASVCAFHGPRGLGVGIGGKAAPGGTQKSAPPKGEQPKGGEHPKGGEQPAPGGVQPAPEGGGSQP